MYTGNKMEEKNNEVVNIDAVDQKYTLKPSTIG